MLPSPQSSMGCKRQSPMYGRYCWYHEASRFALFENSYALALEFIASRYCADMSISAVRNALGTKAINIMCITWTDPQM